MVDFEEIHSKIANHIVKERSRSEHAEIHTPKELIEKMVFKIPKQQWEDPNKTWLDPCSGIGNFSAVIAERLMETLKDKISDPVDRYKHIMENQIFMIEIQPQNAIMIEKLFNPSGELNLNIKCVDALELEVEYMKPSDWKTERFRTSYGTQHNFFERTPSDKEVELLETVSDLCEEEPDWIYKQFERGYEQLKKA